MDSEKVFKEVQELLRARGIIDERIRDLSESKIFEKDKCPLNLKDKEGNNLHYLYSRSIFGVQGYKWICQFCGEEDYV